MSVDTDQAVTVKALPEIAINLFQDFVNLYIKHCKTLSLSSDKE